MEHPDKNSLAAFIENTLQSPTTTEFSKKTQEYKDLVDARPALRPYSEAGLNVIVLFENQAY